MAQARAEDIWRIRQNLDSPNPSAEVLEADLDIDVDDPSAIRGKRALVVEDGPTLTHGGMAFGAGTLAARKFAAADLIDPRPFAVGTIAEAYRAYPHLEDVLPALGYSHHPRDESRETILACVTGGLWP